WILILAIEPVTVECTGFEVRNKTAEVAFTLGGQGEWHQRILVEDNLYTVTFWCPNAKGDTVGLHLSAKTEAPMEVRAERLWSFSHVTLAFVPTEKPDSHH